MSTSINAIATRAIAITVAAVLVLATAATASTSAELNDKGVRAWNGEPALLPVVYAEDAVHTATFYDRTNEYVGPGGIAAVAGYGGIEPIGPTIDIPAADGELRWAGFATLAGGTACLFHAVDGKIVRHDCVLPETSRSSRPAAGLAGPGASAEIDAVMERLRDAWSSDTTVERLAEVYAEDAVHSARYLNRTRVYEGPEGIRAVVRGSSPELIGERVDFVASEGELAWGGVFDVAGGSVCLFRAVDGLITRHDCVLPIAG